MRGVDCKTKNLTPRHRLCRLKSRAAPAVRRAITTRASSPKAVVAATAAADRPLWYPGSTPPAHLDGSLPGDFGFDPLNLSEDPEMKKWLVQAELQHARWAMLGVAGMVAPELLTKIGITNLPNWIDANTFEYWAPTDTLIYMMFAMMNWAEIRRYKDMTTPGSMNTDPFTGVEHGKSTDVGYPGAIFDRLGYAKGNLAELKLKEIKNGRLAMLAVTGCFAQAVTTGTGPVENLFAHLGNPGAVNIFTAMGEKAF